MEKIVGVCEHGVEEERNGRDVDKNQSLKHWVRII
jgi:hypothetical protein